MALMMVWSLLVLLTLVWLVTGIWKTSRGWAVATVFLGPFGAVVPTLRERDNPETRVTLPFVANLVFTVLFGISLVTAVQQAWREEAALQAAQAAQAAAQAPALVDGAAGGVVPVTAAALNPADDLPKDPVVRFSHHLREAGLTHAVQPMEPGVDRPRGATQAVRLAVQAPAGDGRVLDAVLLQCTDGRACHRLAGSAKSGRFTAAASPASAAKGASPPRSPGPQVTQNGLMLLVVNPAAELDGLHHVVQGVFRRTSFAPT